MLKKGPSLIYRSPSINTSMTKAKWGGEAAPFLPFGATNVALYLSLELVSLSYKWQGWPGSGDMEVKPTV